MPGRLADPDKVIVDIGTGYFVEKVRHSPVLPQTRAEARSLYQDKVNYVVKNMEQLQETIHRKQDNLRVVGELLQVVRTNGRAQSHSRNFSVARKARRKTSAMYTKVFVDCRPIAQLVTQDASCSPDGRFGRRWKRR